jgi:hypothetical protein
MSAKIRRMRRTKEKRQRTTLRRMTGGDGDLSRRK